MARYPDLDSLQDFVDRVTSAIESQKGTKNEVKYPGAFMDSCFEKGIDVPSNYKSRKTLAEEEALKREQLELEELKKIREEKRRIEVDKAKINFEAWLEQVAASRVQEFETERQRLYPSVNGFAIPASIRLKQLKEIQVDAFILEEGISPHIRKDLLER